jgi:hypothetical protein
MTRAPSNGVSVHSRRGFLKGAAATSAAAIAPQLLPGALGRKSRRRVTHFLEWLSEYLTIH